MERKGINSDSKQGKRNRKGSGTYKKTDKAIDLMDKGVEAEEALKLVSKKDIVSVSAVDKLKAKHKKHSIMRPALMKSVKVGVNKIVDDYNSGEAPNNAKHVMTLALEQESRHNPKPKENQINIQVNNTAPVDLSKYMSSKDVIEVG